MSLHSVIYTDGSARPNPGNIGWGVHGYIYQNITDKPIIVQKHTITNKGYLYPEKFKDDVSPVEPIEYIDIEYIAIEFIVAERIDPGGGRRAADDGTARFS